MCADVYFFYLSSPKPVDVGFSEFWSRDDEAAASEDDISDDDGVYFVILFNLAFLVDLSCQFKFLKLRNLLPDGNDVVEGLTQSALPSKSRISDKMELLQRAEEKYYQNKDPEKQVICDG